MQKIIPIWLIFGLLVITTASFAQPTQPQRQPENQISASGTVVFNQTQGGFWGIVGEDGTKYDPSYLPSKFKEEGLKVRFKARILKGFLSYHNWGEPVAIESIDQLE